MAPADEAPPFHLVDDLDLALGVPRLGRHVDAMDLDEVVFVAPAGVAHVPGVTGAHGDGTVRAPPAAMWRWTGKEAAMAASITAPAIRSRKARAGSDPLVMVTAYDAPGARMADEAGVDLILVGDSLAMVVLGYDDTLQVTVDDMAHHVAAVARAKPRPLVVGDLPWMSYHVSIEDTVRNAAHARPRRRARR